MTEKELNRLAALLELRVVRALVAEMGDAFERMLGRAEDKVKATSPPAPKRDPAWDHVSVLPCPHCPHPHVSTRIERGLGVASILRGVRDKRQRHCDTDRGRAPRRAKSERVIDAEGLATYLGHGCGCEGDVVCGHGQVCSCQHIRAWERAND